MKRIRQKFFILNYLGSLLLITAIFVPIVKFNNQSFAFIDQFFYLSFAIVILSTITLILATIKKFKLSLIPTLLNIIIIVYGIYDILTIEGIKSTQDFSYGIAFLLFPIGIILNIIGGLLATNNITKEKEDVINDKKISLKNDNNNNINDTLEVEEPNDIIEDSVINLDYNEQIPISNLLNKNDTIDDNQDYKIDDNNSINNKFDISNDEMLDTTNQNVTQDNISDSDNEVMDNDKIENLQNSAGNDEVTTQGFNNSKNVEKISVLSEDDNLLEEIDEYEYNDDDFFEEIDEDKTINNNDIINIPSIEEEILMEDINDNQSVEQPESKVNLDTEIPDINNENVMTNNTQIEDEPKPEFMALNPSDIKIDNKKTLFKQKEKKEENPLERMMKRNIPTTLGRTCQFCNTPLGDDERICPICGRIN